MMKLEKTDEQKQSPLFGNLSNELRNRIFDYALTLNPISLTSGGFKLPPPGPLDLEMKILWRSSRFSDVFISRLTPCSSARPGSYFTPSTPLMF